MIDDILGRFRSVVYLIKANCKKCNKIIFIKDDDLGKEEERICINCKKSNILLIEYKK